MEFKWSIVYLGFLITWATAGPAADVCNGPFTEFLQCMSLDTDARIENYNKELTPAAQSRLQQCFLQVNCAPPDFAKAKVEFFVQEPWTGRINAFLAIIDGMDPKIQRCMTDYFKGITQNKINECIKKHGSKDIKDFQMPPIPGFYNVDPKKMKALFLNRMMVKFSLSQCGTLVGNPQGQQNLISCVKAARQEDTTQVCKSRESCVQKNINDPKCHERFDKVRQTACECFAGEQGQKELEKEMKDTILSGTVERKFKECHDQNGIRYPKEKVDAAKAAAKAGFLEVLQNQGQVPQGVQGALSAGKAVLGEMGEQWKGAFCSDCNDVNADTLRQTAAAIQEPQLAPSPFINQFQSANQFQPAAALPASSAGSLVGAGSVANSQPRFVMPPPLPPQASASQPAQSSVPQQAASSAMSFEEFKRSLAQAFGPVG